MDKDKIIEVMLESFNSDTRLMMQSLNWEIDTINQKIEENQQSLYFMLSNAYDRLKESGLIE